MILEKNKYNLIFIGTPDFSVPTLQTLISDGRFNISAVITAPDAKVGRKQIVTPPPVKVIAEKNNFKILQPAKISAITKEIKNLNPDVIIIIAYGQIIPLEIINIPKHGCLNLHASLLPNYRGASPIQAAIANGDQETGVTLMKINAELDAGDIITQEKVKINNCLPREGGDPVDNTRDSRFHGNDKLETGASLHDKLAELSAGVTKKHLVDYLAGKLKPQPQNDTQATFAPKLTRANGRIDWNKPAEIIERLIRAYYPWPGTWSKLNLPREIIPSKTELPQGGISQGKTLKIISATVISNNKSHLPGTIFLHKNKLAVQCKQDAILINQLQLEGKKQTTSQEFMTGHAEIIGIVLK